MSPCIFACDSRRNNNKSNWKSYDSRSKKVRWNQQVKVKLHLSSVAAVRSKRPPAIYPCSGTPSNKHLARIPQPRHVRFVRTLLLLIAWPIRRDFADTRALPVRAPGIPPSCAIATTWKAVKGATTIRKVASRRGRAAVESKRRRRVHVYARTCDKMSVYCERGGDERMEKVVTFVSRAIKGDIHTLGVSKVNSRAETPPRNLFTNFPIRTR